MNKIHANRPQIEALAILARVTLCILGRGTGKTEGITSNWILNNMLAMPRSVGGLIVPAYDGAEKILAGIRKGFAKVGYRENEHYVIGIKPPDEWGEKGYNAPAKDFKNYVSFYNGSGFYILSSNAKHNGSNLDWLIVEEAKLIPEVFFRETYLAVRGNDDLFGNYSHHGSLLVITDRPRDNEEQWIYTIEKQALQPENKLLIDMIKAILLHINTLTEKSKEVFANVEVISHKIANYKSQLNSLRKIAVNLVEASTLENIAVLGINKINEYRKTLSPYDFAVSVLNYKPLKAEYGFYPFFKPSLHAYYADNDILDNQPLHIGCDYNAAICCMEVVQSYANQFKVVRSLDTTHGLEHLCSLFAELFKYRTNKLVYFHFDHTAKQGKGASRNSERYYQIVINELTKLGFNCIGKDMGYTTTHDTRFSYYSKLFSGKTATVFTYNAKYCENLAISLSSAKATYIKVDGKTYIGKDKSYETNLKLNQSHTTHHSEALDSLVTALLMKKSNSSFESI